MATAGYTGLTEDPMTLLVQIPFSKVTKTVRNEMAMCLDQGGNANWEILAEELGCSPHSTQWIRSRACNFPHGSPTLLFFDEYCVPRDINLGQVMNALRCIGNLQCARVLTDHYTNGTFTRNIGTLSNENNNVRVPVQNTLDSAPRLSPSQDNTQMSSHLAYSHPGEPNSSGAMLKQQTGAMSCRLDPMSTTPFPTGDRFGHTPLDLWSRVENIGNDVFSCHPMLTGSDDPTLMMSRCGSMDVGVDDSLYLYDDRLEETTYSDRYVEEPLPLCEGLGRTDFNLPSLNYPLDGGLGYPDVGLDLRSLSRGGLKPAADANQSPYDHQRRREGRIFAGRCNDRSGDNVALVRDRIEPSNGDAGNACPPNVVVKKESCARLKEEAVGGLRDAVMPMAGAGREVEGGVVMAEGGAKSKKSPAGKRLTDPLSFRDLQLLCASPDRVPARSTIANMQLSEFKEDSRRICVFVTYSNDSKQHMKNVMRLCDCLKKNEFSVSIDIREPQLVSQNRMGYHDMRYKKAHYVLVLISPQYHRDVTVNETASQSDSESSLNTLYIYRRMQTEYLGNQCVNHRFIPVLMPGVSQDNVPDWLRNATIYTWPDHYKNLFFFMLHPAQVVNEYITRELGTSHPTVQTTKK